MESTRPTRTQTLLRYGWLAGPFYLTVGLAQAFIREGFDLGRHPLSALANGPGGWIQTANFFIGGLMVVAASVGIRKALRPRSGAGGWILMVFGISMLLAALFPADAADGFPPGTPEGMPTSISTTGMLHFVAGMLGFLALAVSAIVTGITLKRGDDKAAGLWSLVAGIAVFSGFFFPALIPASGPVAGIWFSVVVGWIWLAWVCAYLSRKAH